MAEEIKDQEGGDQASDQELKDSFVEIEGKKFKEDPENKGQPLKDEKGDPVPFEEKKEEKKEDAIDYKAELEKKTKQLEKAGFVIQGLKKELKKKEEIEEGEEEEVEPSITKEDVQEIVRKETGVLQKRMLKNQARDLAQARAGSKDEAKLIMFYYENLIVPTGNLEEDIENAQILANKGRLKEELSATKRALISKETKGKGAGAGQKLPAETKAPVLSKGDQILIKRHGLKWDAKARKGKGAWVGKTGRVYDLPTLTPKK